MSYNEMLEGCRDWILAQPLPNLFMLGGIICIAFMAFFVDDVVDHNKNEVKK